MCEHFFDELETVKAVLILCMSFLCVLALICVLVLHICDLSMVVSFSSVEELSFKEICRASAYLIKGEKHRILLNFLASIIPLAITVFSAGLLSFATIPRIAMSRALLENDIIKEYKTNNNI